MGVACWKILGLVTSRRKLASTIGISVNDLPDLEAPIASSSQPSATAWCGWSLREAATSTLTSGVIVKRPEQRLVAQRIHALDQAAPPVEHRHTNPVVRRGVRLRAKAQLKALLNQARQTCALLGRKRLGVGQQLIVQVQRRFHA
jgi:hypothetical protein